MENQSQIDKISQSKIDEKEQKKIIIGLSIFLIILLASLVFSIWYLLQDAERTELIKNVITSILGVELLVIGISTVILIIQFSKLINLMKNEVKPVLDAANETMNTVRGTAAFMSDQMVEPVIKINSAYAGIRKVLGIFKKG